MNRRIVVGVASVALVALALIPARAGTPINGTILMATAGSPAAARMAYVLNGHDNVGDRSSSTWALGFVAGVPGWATDFKIAPITAGSVGDFDIFFYDGGPFPENALPDEDNADMWAGPGPHCGPLPDRASWAIVTLAVGAAEPFALQFNNGPLTC